MNITDLYNGILARDERLLAKACSFVEDRAQGYDDLLSKLYANTGTAKIIGITGAPGSGKSTLINSLALLLAKKEFHVAVIAVDPSSQISAGAVLGDRIRMRTASEHNNIFVRSVSSRGQKGGVALAIADLIDLFDAAKFDYIIVETVGVGQVESDIVDFADFTALLVAPGSGDEVQAMKAGILELVDFVILNKSDEVGANKLEYVLKSVLLMDANVDKIKIFKTSAVSGEGLEALVLGIINIFDDINFISKQKHIRKQKKVIRVKKELEYLVRNKFEEYLAKASSNNVGADMMAQVHPAKLAQEILKNIAKS